MKNIFTLFCLMVLLSVFTFAQAPQKMNYQAVVRNASNSLVTNQNVSARITILQGGATGSAVYMETHTVTTNANGLMTLSIGNGTTVSGTFANIDWADGPYFLKSEIDLNDGTSYSIETVQQLMSVPYALYAATSGNGEGPEGPQGPQGETGATGPQGPTGEDGRGIQNIIGPVSNNLTDTYTIIYTDGTTSTFTVTNGAAGAQGPIGPTGPAGEAGVSPTVTAVAEGSNILITVTDGMGTHTYTIPTTSGEVSQQPSDWNATSGVTQILNKPTIPTTVSELINDANYITLEQIPAQENADWNATEGVAQILNKPEIPVVPTNVGAFENDANYITEANLTSLYELVNILNFKIDSLNEVLANMSQMPEIETISVSGVSIHSAIFSGNIVSEGYYSVIGRGFCYATHQNPVISDLHTSDGSGNGTFDHLVTGLEANTTYYVRAYATTSVAGTLYGPQLSFTTKNMPVVNTAAVTDISISTAISGGEITANEGITITARGVCWSTSQNPTIRDNHTSDGSGTGTFTSNITGLSASTTYYVRAYATNSEDISYGSQVSFTTKSIPVVTTAAVTDISSSTAISGGTVTADEGITITARGICWSTSQNPTISDNHTTDGDGTGRFTSSITNLSASTTYYVRAYATYSEGIAYGSLVNFTTQLDSTLPFYNFIGTTYYDLQTNGSMTNKVIAHNDGTISTVWTTNGFTASTRGTGYNYFNGNNWINASNSTDRIENVRTGWGTLTCVGDVEIMAAHNGSTALVIGVCPQKGSNNWTFTTLQGPEATNGNQVSTCLLWPSLASSGNIIHLIACTESDAGYLYQGIQTCLLYYRGTFDATSNTISWEQPRIVGNVTSADVNKFQGDGYAIAAKDNTVAIVAAPGMTKDAFLWKSTDNGINFTKTVFFDTPPAGDTSYRSDGSLAVAIGDDGLIHVAMGTYRSYIETDTSSRYTWYPGAGYMFYWNENMAPVIYNGSQNATDPEIMVDSGHTIFERFNLDCDTSLWGLSSWSNDAYPSYGVGVVSFPQLVSEGGNVYLVFCQLMEYPFIDVNNSMYYRGVFATKSTDNGQSFGDYSWLSYNKDCYYLSDWSMFPMDSTTSYEEIAQGIYTEGESVFPAVAPNLVNGRLTMIWQQDYNAGSEVKESSVSVTQNESSIYFFSIDANEIGVYNNTNEVCQGLWIDKRGVSNRVISGMQMHPDLESESDNVTFSSEETPNADINIVNSMRQTVNTENIKK